MNTRKATRAGRLVLCTSIGMLLVQTAAESAEPRRTAGRSTRSTVRSSNSTTRQGTSAVQQRPKKRSVASRIRSLFSRKSDEPKKKPKVVQAAAQQQNQPKIVRTAAEETAIQRELRLLYQKDGRRMPNMDINRLPTSGQSRTPASRVAAGRTATNRTAASQTSTNQAVPASTAASRTVTRPATRQPVQPAAQRPSKRGIFSRLFKRKSSRPSTAPRYKPTPVPLMDSQRPQQGARQPAVVSQPQPPAPRQAISISQTRVIQQPVSQQQVRQKQSTVPPRPVQSASPFGRTPAAIKTPKPAEAESPFLLGGNDRPTAPVKPKTEPKPVNSLDNPFPELSEAEADGQPAKTNPFARRSVPTKTLTPVKTEKKTVESTNPAALKNQPSPFVEKTVAPKPSVEKKPKPAVKRTVVTTPKPTPQATVPAPKKSNASKFDRIAARSGQPGLRGFCPVQLRDHRELVDVKTEFHVKYRGTTYQVSSAKAQATFEKSPSKYAPVQGGHDVIELSTGSAATHGSLQHAVWFKDRLYLFTSTETLNTFVRDPKQFANRFAE